MRDVKVFMATRMPIKEVEDCLTKKGIGVHGEAKPCDVSVAIYGAHINPLALKGKRVLIYWVQKDKAMWSLAFRSLYLPILKEYYNELNDLSHCSTFTEIGNEIVKHVEQFRKSVS